MKMTMYRATQNPDTPNLPFAQSLSPTMFRDMQNADTPNLPFAQGFSNTEKQYVLMSLGKLTQNVSTNTRNLVQMGTDMTKIGKDNTWFGKKITELENRPSGTGRSQAQIEKIVEGYHGDDISLLHSHAVDFGTKLKTTKQERDRIEAKVNANKEEHAVMWDSIGQKSDSSHFHNNGGGNGKDCGWDIGCHIENFKAQVGGVALIGVAVLGGYLLLRRKIKL